MLHALRPLNLAVSAILLTGTIALGAAPAHADEAVETGDHVTGLQMPTTEVSPQAAVQKYNRMALGAGTLPVSVDLTQYAVAPGDQGKNGACVSWAIAYTMMGWWANKAGTPETFAPMYVYSQTHLDDTEDGGGSYAKDAYAVTSQQGVDTAAHYTQGNRNFKTKPTAAEIANAAQYKTTSATTLFASDDSYAGSAGITAIKQALANGTPVGIGMNVYGGFENLDRTRYTWHMANNGALEGGHYVTALGYDSTGLLIENSWGSDWGKAGYAVLGWDYVADEVFEAETINGFQNVIPSAGYTPGKVQQLTVDTTTNSLTAIWDAPTSTGSKAFTGYTATVTGVNFRKTYNIAESSSPSFTARGLKPNSAYTVAVTANNGVGSSAPVTVIAKTKNDSPKLGKITVTKAKTSLKLKWTAATANSGHITKYLVRVTKNGKKVYSKTIGASTRSVTIKHLKRNTAYSVSFTAVNSVKLGSEVLFKVKTSR